ncbi:MAG: Fur family transcriptional regulator [Tepidiformaceae bacterium]
MGSTATNGTATSGNAATTTIAAGTAARLSGDGRRITGPRRRVLRAMTAAKRPFTVEELCAELPDVGRATVFRTVRLLVDTEVLCRVVIEDGTVRYQLSDGEHHHHLVCSCCGSLQDFADPAMDRLIEANAEARQFALAGHAIELYGVCAACQAPRHTD